ncbi:hypothetical protein PENDEC_c024G05370 [Penicillium decumbens]|uniref:N-acetyltransferase domain-containing protein n=1 Tax=Penicillium decumbens TaxID=69771 RepID=A0A1V6P088_PENDC|nr:hypothetical protein PENDEC_c024G05370 [Penicillium decumbens]
MAFEVEPASPSDAPQMARVFLAAFSDDFNKTMLPRTEDVRAWVTGHLVGGSGAKNHEVFLKINDAEGKIVAFAKWALPNAGPDPDPIPDSEEVSWPVSSDAELCDRFFGTMERYHHELMGERRHYYLEILGVDPAYQGYGLGSKLLKWGLSRADEEGVEVYLCSSPEGRRVYEKYGFEGKIPFSLFPGREHLFMIRPIRK